MTDALHNVAKLSYYLGLFSLLLTVVVRLWPAAQDVLRLTPRGGLVLAATLFLCVLASQAVARWNG